MLIQIGQKSHQTKNLKIKSLVLFAAYLFKNHSDVDIDEEIDNYLKGEELLGIEYVGEDVDVQMIPVKVGESWFDKGCKYFNKLY